MQPPKLCSSPTSLWVLVAAVVVAMMVAVVGEETGTGPKLVEGAEAEGGATQITEEVEAVVSVDV